MKTEIIKIDPEKINDGELDKAAEILKDGGIVAFPTETVYGLGANALDEKAVLKIFEAKGRPSDNPLIVHIAEIEQIEELIDDDWSKAEKLIKAFWPGPLTLIFKKSDKIPYIITAGLDTVAIRMPSHPIAKALIKKANIPVAAPSANISGKPSPTKGEHVIDDLFGKVDLIVDGGDAEVGLESTILDITGALPVILRPGGITKEQLEEIIGPVELDAGLQGEGVPKAPGMKYTHYAPEAPVIVFEGDEKDIVRNIKNIQAKKENEGLVVGIMATSETEKQYDCDLIKTMGSRNNPETIAQNLFAILRAFDKEKVDIILVEGIALEGVGQAVMNRMLKSSGYTVVKG